MTPWMMIEWWDQSMGAAALSSWIPASARPPDGSIDRSIAALIDLFGERYGGCGE